MSIDRPIGVLDSGVGGLTVLRKMKSMLPRESAIYFADSGRLPYGEKSRDQVRRFVREIVSFLADNGAKAILIACNTATAAAVDDVAEYFDGPVVGVIAPGARAAVRSSGKKGTLGLIATQGTVDSGAYDRELRTLGFEGVLLKRGCPELVLLAEGRAGTEDPIGVCSRALSMYKGRRLDALILGCTHFPLLEGYIKDVLPGVLLVDPAEEAVKELQVKLSDQGLLSNASSADYRFFTSGDVESFRRILQDVLGPDDWRIQQKTLG